MIESTQPKEFEVVREIGKQKLTIRAGKLAKQAAGCAWVQYGDTVVLVASSTCPCLRDIDFFPLFMDYREKQYAAGKVPRGFFKREGRPTEKEILTMRLMDRPVRPLFPEGYRDEVQVQAIVLSFDQQNESDILAVIGASACLCLSPIPFEGPLGCVRVGRIDGQFVINPTITQLETSDLDLVLAGTMDELNMMEMGAKEASEEDLVAAFEFGHRFIREICQMQNELVGLLGVEKPWTPPEPVAGLKEAVERYADELRSRLQTTGKQERAAALDELKSRVLEELSPAEAESPRFERLAVAAAFSALKSKLVRELILEGRRPDGRGPNDLRPIHCEVGILPRTHGSALFTRGETQALVAATLGTGDDQQVIDGLAPEYKKRFMLQYNFPPFSVGEVRPIRGPGRREIGHGNLAERSLEHILPPIENFAYTMLVVSETLESNGSSSMATVCGATLAMMDAGIAISDPVAGVSIGLVKEGGRSVLLTDIMGDEDHYGDMDFKVAGTQHGVTAIQLDMKIRGTSIADLAAALQQAREARVEILRLMLHVLPAPRAKISDYAPRLLFMRIDPQKIGKVIGPGGKMIKAIEEETGAHVEIEDDGTIMISCLEMKGAEEAKARIEAITGEIAVGRIYPGEVVSVKDFGAFIELPNGEDGMCHISELADGFVKRVDDVVKIGDKVRVKVILIDPNGRIKLSRKAALREEGDKTP